MFVGNLQFVWPKTPMFTTLPLRDAGTQWILPLEFKRFNSLSVKWFSPHRRKTTKPKCLVAGISNRLSFNTRSSNFLASCTPYENKPERVFAYYTRVWFACKLLTSRMCFWSPFIPKHRITNHSFNALNRLLNGICQCFK